MCGFIVCLFYNGFNLFLIFGIINLKSGLPSSFGIKMVK